MDPELTREVTDLRDQLTQLKDSTVVGPTNVGLFLADRMARLCDLVLAVGQASEKTRHHIHKMADTPWRTSTVVGLPPLTLEYVED